MGKKLKTLSDLYKNKDTRNSEERVNDYFDYIMASSSLYIKENGGKVFSFNSEFSIYGLLTPLVERLKSEGFIVTYQIFDSQDDRGSRTEKDSCDFKITIRW